MFYNYILHHHDVIINDNHQWKVETAIELVGGRYIISINIFLIIIIYIFDRSISIKIIVIKD